MFTQLHDDGQDFVVVYSNQSNKMKAKYSLYEGDHIAMVWAISSL
jgi:hypothetical protein